jgi:uncharacterized protein (UPF0335 family)
MPKKAVQEAEPREDADNTPAAFGDNAKPLLVEYVQAIEECNHIIEKQKDTIKDLLEKAKKNGFLKTAVRNTVKKRAMSSKEKAAQKSIEQETERLMEMLVDLPLFQANDNQE